MSYVPGFLESTVAGGLLAQPATVAGLTLSQWGTVATIGSTALSGAQLISGAIQQSSAGEASANAAEANAAQARAEAERNAALVKAKAASDKRQLQGRFEREQASRNAYLGKYGSGGESALELLAGAAESHVQDLASVDYTADLDVQSVLYGGETAARAQTQQASQARARASNAMSNMPWSVGETMLSGGAKAYRMYKGL